MIVGGCNGILFSYFAEGPFYLMNHLGLSPRDYGLSFVMIAMSAMVGGIVSKKLGHHHSGQNIIKYGL